MMDTLKLFFDKHKGKLIKYIESYLQESVSHEEMVTLGWEIINDWSALDEAIKSLPCLKGEEAFWAIVWSVIHLCDEGHWTNGIPQRDFPLLLKALKDEASLPKGHHASRP